VGVRANLALALQRGRFDIVHGFEPGLPSLSYLALRDSHALGVATFLSAERLREPAPPPRPPPPPTAPPPEPPPSSPRSGSGPRRASLSASASSRVSMHCLRPR